MRERAATVTLDGGDGRESIATASIEVFTPTRRITRALIVLAGGGAVAVALLPIPIIHLLGIPLALVAALVLAIRQLRTAARLSRVQLPCPRCTQPQWFGGAGGIAHVDHPVDVTCDSCRRGLVLTIAPLPEATGHAV